MVTIVLELDETIAPRHVQRERAIAATRALLHRLDAIEPPLV